MNRIDSESREGDCRELLSWDPVAGSHVLGFVQIPGADRSARTTAYQQALRRVDLDLTATAGDFPQRLGVSAGRAVKNQHRAAARNDQKVADGIDGDIGESLSFGGGKIESGVGSAKNSLGSSVSVRQPVEHQDDTFTRTPAGGGGNVNFTFAAASAW